MNVNDFIPKDAIDGFMLFANITDRETARQYMTNNQNNIKQALNDFHNNRNSNEDVPNTIDLTMSSPLMEEDKVGVDPHGAIEAVPSTVNVKKKLSEVDRKNSSTTETTSVNQEQFNRQKKIKTDNNDVINNLADEFASKASTNSGSKSDDSLTTKKSTSARKPKSKSNLKAATSIAHTALGLSHTSNPYAGFHLLTSNQSGGMVLKSGNGESVSKAGMAAEARRGGNVSVSTHREMSDRGKQGGSAAQRRRSLLSGREKQEGQRIEGAKREAR